MSIKNFNLGALGANLRASSGDRTATILGAEKRSSSTAGNSTISSIFQKRKLTDQAKRNGAINFALVSIAENYFDTLNTLSRKTKDIDAVYTTRQAREMANIANYQGARVFGLQQGEYEPSRDYRRGNLGKKKVKKIRGKNDFKDFVKKLNDLYKTKGLWTIKYGYLVNGTPDSPYFVPVETPIAVPNKPGYHTGIPLGFSWDPVMQLIRIVYIPTGDIMFGFVYDDPMEAIKGRMIHEMMLDWALPPEGLASMYNKWFASPALYKRTFEKLHQKVFGEEPRLFIENPAIISGTDVLSRAYPNYLSHNQVRMYLLTTVGGLGGVAGNSRFDLELHNKLVNTQVEQYINGLVGGLKTANGLTVEPMSMSSTNFNNIPKAPPRGLLRSTINEIRNDISDDNILEYLELERKTVRQIDSVL